MRLFDAVSDLPLTIESSSFEEIGRTVLGGSRRTTTLVKLYGLGATGSGEELTFQQEDHAVFLSIQDAARRLRGHHLIRSISAVIEELLSTLPPPSQSDSLNYRQWAFESAALDLALCQNATSLADILKRELGLVNFVASLRIDSNSNLGRLEALLRLQGLQLKLDVTADWTADFMDSLGRTGKVSILDFKAFYKGTTVDLVPDPALYKAAIVAFPDAMLEDLDLRVLDSAYITADILGRLSYDEPIYSADDVVRLSATAVNIKPARIGTVERLFDLYDHCISRGIRIYGGGLFEIGVGREQVQYLASLFHATEPNDIAPSEYNFPGQTCDLTLPPLRHFRGFGRTNREVRRPNL